ncbi:MAG: hypothetical protein IT384_05715 [Deltaproteobacteria bacterium]|nr:hypothetical protein [Deltaproteobacteria bacterium]
MTAIPGAAPGERLGGPAKAALLILALDEDVAAQVLGHLSEDQLRRLAEYAEQLSPSALDALENTYEEFERMMRAPGPVGPAAAGAYFRNLAAKAIGEDRALRLLAPPGPPTAATALRSARISTLSELLESEHPQLAAVIVAQLPKDRAAKVLAAMDASRQSEVIKRLAELTDIPAEMAELASEALAKVLAGAGALGGSESKKFDGAVFTAGVLNELDHEDTTRLLDGLAARSEKAAAKVRDAMFTFDELSKLDKRSIQTVMKEISSDQLLVALKAASTELQELFFSAVSTRAATAMREELTLLPPMRLSEVELTQRAIVEVVLRLAGEGRLALPGRGSEKLV